MFNVRTVRASKGVKRIRHSNNKNVGTLDVNVEVTQVNIPVIFPFFSNTRFNK